MPSRLSLHCHRAGPDVDQIIRSAPWACVKALDTVAPLQTAQAAGIQTRVLRCYGMEVLTPAAAAAHFLAFDLGAVTHLQLVCETTQGYDPAWQQGVIDALRAGGYQGRYLVGGYATGTPATVIGNPPHFPALEPIYPLLRRPDVDLALDAYTGILASDPRWAQWAPWTALRPTLLHDDLARQGIAVDVVVTESGGDNAPPVPSGGGWQARGWSQADYLATLAAIDRDDQAHDWLLARCIFTLGAPPDWATYEIANIAPQLAAYVQSQKGPTVQRGIDVSSAQTALDWPAIAASGVTFAAVKATEGVGWPSPAFAAQWAGAGAAGLTRIAYHFARPDLGNAPVAEAAYFVGIVKPTLRPGDLVALDLEVGSGDLSAWALGWLDAVTTALGFRPLCYSYPSFIFASLRAPALAAYPLWYASYQATEPPAPAPWGAIAIWQDDDVASVPGVGGLVDGDLTWLSAADLRGLGKPAPDPQPQGGLNEVIQITPAIIVAARARLSALGQHVVPGGAIETELIARYALGQANPQLGTAGVTPVVGAEVALPDGRAYCLLDSGELCEWANGRVDNPEQKDRAAILAQCWPGRFA